MADEMDDVADAIRETLNSMAEQDRDTGSANVVDGLFEIARALHRIASALEDPAPWKVDVQRSTG